jgi:surface polysaccharide O-acyltransferase-like enzyme
MDQRVVFLDNLRGVAVFMVVCIHTFAYSLPLPELQRAVLAFVVHTIAVPVFFLTDGFLFAFKNPASDAFHYVSYVKRSAFRLMLPWSIFSALYALAFYLSELAGFFDEKMISGSSFGEIAVSAYMSKLAPQMYFLFSLFLVRLASPVSIRILNLKPRYLPACFLAYYLFYSLTVDSVASVLTIPGRLEPTLHAYWGYQFYLAGMIICRMKLLRHKSGLLILFAMLFGAVLLHNPDPAGLFDYRSHLDQYLYLMVFFFFFAHLNQNISLITKMGLNSMGIYLLHAPVLLKGASMVINRVVTEPLLSFLAIGTGATLLSIMIVSWVNRISYGSLLFGVRPGSGNARIGAKTSPVKLREGV